MGVPLPVAADASAERRALVAAKRKEGRGWRKEPDAWAPGGRHGREGGLGFNYP
jgi:hypothetical protein